MNSPWTEFQFPHRSHEVSNTVPCPVGVKAAPGESLRSSPIAGKIKSFDVRQ